MSLLCAKYNDYMNHQFEIIIALKTNSIKDFPTEKYVNPSYALVIGKPADTITETSDTDTDHHPPIPMPLFGSYFFGSFLADTNT